MPEMLEVLVFERGKFVSTMPARPKERGVNEGVIKEMTHFIQRITIYIILGYQSVSNRSAPAGTSGTLTSTSSGDEAE